MASSHSLTRLPSAHLTQLHERASRLPPSFSFISLAQSLDNPWLAGIPLTFSLRSSNPNSLFSLARRRITASVALSLPTGNPDKVKDVKLPKWSARGIKAFAMGELEARKLKYTNTGTESLLMGILIEGTSRTAKFLRALGITLTKVKDESVKLLGKGDFFFFSPEHPPLTEAAQRALDYAVDETLKSG